MPEREECWWSLLSFINLDDSPLIYVTSPWWVLIWSTSKYTLSQQIWSHNILEPLPEHPLWSLQRNLICTQRFFFCTQRYLLVPTSSPPFSPNHLIIPLRLHSSLPHSSNATYTYNGLGIISFHKDGVLTGSRMLCFTQFLFFYYQPTLKTLYMHRVPAIAKYSQRRYIIESMFK
jgi:hypothetical protein